eukprot:gene30559-36932_t
MSASFSLVDIVRAQVFAQKVKKKAKDAVHGNIANLKEKTKSNLFPKDFKYKPLITEDFLRTWLDFPVKYRNVPLNLFLVPLRWLVWTNRSMAGLEPTDSTIRERLCNSISVLGTAAGLFLVIAVEGLLSPPDYKTEFEHILVNVYGVLMYTSTISFTMYIGISLTGIYPIIQSLRDDIAFDAFENFKNRWGGYELYMFNVGLQTMAFALLVYSTVVYSPYAVLAMLSVFLLIYWFVVKLSQEMFLALDPISAMHLGLTNDPNDIYRAELMSRYILGKVPNNILEESEVFNEQVESAKENDEEDKPPSEHVNSISNSLKEKLHRVVGRVHEQGGHEHGSHNPDVFDSQPGSQPSHQPVNRQPPEHHAHPHTGLFSQSTSSPSSHMHATPAPIPVCSTLLPAAQTHELPVLSVDLPSLSEVFTGEEYWLKSRVPVAIARVVHDQIVMSGCDTMRSLLDYLDENKTTYGVSGCSCSKYKTYVSRLQAKAKAKAHNNNNNDADQCLIDDYVAEEACVGQFFCSTANFRGNTANTRKSHLRSSFSSKPVNRRQVVPENVERSTVDDSRQHADTQPELSSYDAIHDEDCALRRCGCWQAALEHLVANKVSPFYCCQIIKTLKVYLK